MNFGGVIMNNSNQVDLLQYVHNRREKEDIERKIDKLDQKVDVVKNDLEKKIDKLDQKIDTVKSDLEKKIDTVKNDLEKKMDKLDNRMDRLEDKFDILGAKFDSLNKWAFGLVVVLIVGFIGMVVGMVLI